MSEEERQEIQYMKEYEYWSSIMAAEADSIEKGGYRDWARHHF